MGGQMQCDMASLCMAVHAGRCVGVGCICEGCGHLSHICGVMMNIDSVDKKNILYDSIYIKF